MSLAVSGQGRTVSCSILTGPPRSCGDARQKHGGPWGVHVRATRNLIRVLSFQGVIKTTSLYFHGLAFRSLIKFLCEILLSKSLP